MTKIDALAQEFLSQPCIAIAGVSPHRDTPANAIYQTLRNRGVTVLAVNPKVTEYLGDRCYPDVRSLPRKPDGIVIVTNPVNAEKLVRECAEAGIRRVWLHSMLGTNPRLMKSTASKITSVSAAVVEICRQNGISVIPGSCPMQFVGDFGHRCIRGFLRITGALEMPA